MAVSEIRLTLSQISKMKHAVGLNNIGNSFRNGKYSAYRNFFATGNKDQEWEELVAIGFATSRYVEWSKEHAYFVSPKGLRYLETLMNITIEVME